MSTKPGLRNQNKKPPAGRYGKRADGTNKGVGYRGEQKVKGGGVATEYSIGVDGREIPSLTPNLSRSQRSKMLNDIIPNKKRVPRDVVGKGAAHAVKREKQGLSPFAASSGKAPKGTRRPTGR